MQVIIGNRLKGNRLKQKDVSYELQPETHGILHSVSCLSQPPVRSAAMRNAPATLKTICVRTYVYMCFYM